MNSAIPFLQSPFLLAQPSPDGECQEGSSLDCVETACLSARVRLDSDLYLIAQRLLVGLHLVALLVARLCGQRDACGGDTPR